MWRLLRDVASMLWVACEALGLDGIAFVPSHFALALQSTALAEVIDPDARPQLAGALEALKGLAFVDKLRAVEEGRLRPRDGGSVFRYEPVPMLVPVSERARDWVREHVRERRPEAYELIEERG